MREKEGWRPPVVKTMAAEGTGIDNVMAELERHRTYCTTLAEVPAAKARAASSEIKEAIKNRLLDDYLKEEWSRSKAIEAHAGAVCRRQSDPYLVVDTMLGEQNSNGPR